MVYHPFKKGYNGSTLGVDDLGVSPHGPDEGTFKLNCSTSGANPAVDHIWLKRVKRRDENGAETKGTELIQIPPADVDVTTETDKK